MSNHGPTGVFGLQGAERIAVLRALQLGDLLCAVPALRALRAVAPRARITLIGLPWARAFVDRFRHYLDGFFEFPGFPGLPEREPSLADLPAFLAAAASERFDLAIQMHGSGEITNPVAVLLGARHTAGFYVPGQFCPDSERFLPYPSAAPEVHRHLKLMAFLGAPSRGDHLEFPIRSEDRAALAALVAPKRLQPREYVCVHPGARAADRRWQPHAFARVADEAAALGLRVVLTGSDEERPLTAAVAASMRYQALDLAGRTSLGSLAALIERARALASNDTGVSHIAAALGVPSVVIFTASDPARWAPLDRRRHRAVTAGPGDIERAIAETRRLLAEEDAHAA